MADRSRAEIERTLQRFGADQFMSNVLVDQAPGGCWLWMGTRHDEGYGRVRVAGKNVYTHRLIYELTVGVIPEGWTIDHLSRPSLLQSSAP